MVGDVRRDAAARGIADRIRTLGTQPDPRPALHAGDALVLPAAYESYGLVVVEALACGLPVIATPTGCVPDVVTDGVDGWVVEATGPAVAAAVERLAAAEPSAVRAAARKAAETQGWADVARRYRDLLLGLRETS